MNSRNINKSIQNLFKESEKRNSKPVSVEEIPLVKKKQKTKTKTLKPT